MLGNIGFSELIMILLVVLLVFGAKRCPKSARPGSPKIGRPLARGFAS